MDKISEHGVRAMYEILKEKGYSEQEATRMISEDAYRNLFSEEDRERVVDKIKEGLGDTHNLEWWYNAFEIPANDRMRKFQLFLNYGKITIDREITKSDEKGWFKQIEEAVDVIRFFEISETLSKVLVKTNSEETYFPYDNFFLSGKFEINNNMYIGILLQHIAITSDDGSEDIYPQIMAMRQSEDEEGEATFKFDVFRIDNLESDGEHLSMGLKRGIANLVWSFCNFLNEQDVEIVEHNYNPKNNERRKERGRSLVCRETEIRIYGDTKRYIDNIRSKYIKSFGMAHWVRGHFFNFRDENKWHRLYKLSDEELKRRGYNKVNGIIRKWKRPFVRGQGKPQNKPYVVKNRE